MIVRTKKDSIITKKNLPELLQKAIKNLDNYELSEFKWIREWQKGYIRYVEEVVDSIATGLALKLDVDPFNVQKSIKFNSMTLLKTADNEISEESLLLKSIWEKLKQKYTKAMTTFKKFFFNKGKPLEPMKIKGRVTYNPETKNALTNQEWKNIETGIVDYLSDTIESPDDEIAIKSGLFGLLMRKMDEEGISIHDQKNLSYDDMIKKFGTDINNTQKMAKEVSKDKVMKQAIDYAKNHAAEFLSIEDGDLKNKIVSIFKKQIVGGLENGISTQEMISRLYWVDPSDELGQRFNNETINAYNRDLRRIVITEMSTAINNGYLAANKSAAKKGEKVYFVYSGFYNPAEKPDEPCNVFLGKICLLTDEPQADDSTNDQYADFLIWNGKTNVGKKKAQQWICIPTHPHCTHYWTRIHPEFQVYDLDTNGIEYKTEMKSKDIYVDNIEWKKDKTESIKTELPKITKKIKDEIGLKSPIVVRLYKEHKSGTTIRSMHDEGVIIMYESSPDWKGDFIHEVAHLLFVYEKLDKKLLNKLEKFRKKIETQKGDGKIFVQPHTYSDLEEMWCTLFKWYILGKIEDIAYLENLKLNVPGGIEIVQDILASGQLKKSEDLIKNDATKKKVTYEGIQINIEWKKGETRQYPGSPYKNHMKANYGYIRNTDSPDGEDVDVYLNEPQAKNAKVYMLNQLHLGDKFTGEFDEHKFMLGFPSKTAAIKCYIESMKKEMYGGIVHLSIENFKKNFLPYFKKEKK